jgi:hypothetical protein
MMKYSAVRNGHMSCGTFCVLVMIHQNLVLSQLLSILPDSFVHRLALTLSLCNRKSIVCAAHCTA